MFSFLLNTWLGVELLGYLVTLCLTLGDLPDYFSKVAAPLHFTFSLAVLESFNFHTFANLLLSIFLL